MPVVLERAEREKRARGEEVTRYTRIAQRWLQFYDYGPGTIAAIKRTALNRLLSKHQAHAALDFAVRDVYDMNQGEDTLAFLLAQNL
jgi:hypothetical protein